MSTGAAPFGTALPVIQAPMAGVQGARLAAAVCAAGGLGSLPCATLSPEATAAELAALRAATDCPFNVNFFCHTPPPADPVRDATWREALRPLCEEFGAEPPAPDAVAGRAAFDDRAATLVEAVRPDWVSFHFGLPAPDLLARVRACGVRVMSSATTVAEARWLEAQGVDAIIAQGLEAGGHRGMFLTDDLTTQLGTFALVPQVVRAVRVPVVAAGGIADAAGVRAALALGASAVQAGTAFLLCPESATPAVHRAALASEAAQHTAITNVFTGRPARSIVNRLMRTLGPLSPVAPAFPRAAAALGPLRARAEAAGSSDCSPLWAGQHARCRAVPAASVVRALAGLDAPG